ncbi:TatD family hydrolase [Nannocystaceae bacterium ST9]
MLYFFDTHTHIHRSRTYRGDLPDKLVERAARVGVRAILLASVDESDWQFLEDFSTNYCVNLVYSWGLHPWRVVEVTPSQTRDLLDQLRMRIYRRPPALCAIGETGLDFVRSRDRETREHQVAVLREHVDLARATGLPLSLHCVHAHGPMLEILLERATPASVMHAFSGSAEVARRLMRAGHYLSFAGNLDRPNARKLIESARAVARDRVLIETDSPDQTPLVRRPRSNEPAFVVDVARRLAEVRGESLDEVADSTRANACRVFRIDERALLCEFPGDLGGDVDRLLALEPEAT